MDIFSKDKRSRIMATIRTRDTGPEKYVRKYVWSHGFRYARKSYNLPGSPDLVFPKYRTVVFVHGCFWHGHSCKRASLPKSNCGFWEAKIALNVKRDLRVSRDVRAQHWHCLRVWQCRLKEDTDRLIKALHRMRNQQLSRLPNN